MHRNTFGMLVMIAALLATVGCDARARDAAAVLAADTGRLNDQIEALTRSRKQIEIARSRLTAARELSTLRTQNFDAGAESRWGFLQAQGNAYATRVSLLNAARKHAEAAATREAEIDVLSTRLQEASEQAKGTRSEHLAETAKLLASLSKEASVQDHFKFLSGFVRTVQDNLEAAKKDAEAAAAAAKKKADEVQKSTTQPA
jgi:hypothetical protein